MNGRAGLAALDAMVARTVDPPREPAGVSVRGVRKAFGEFLALDEVSLDVREGEFLTLLGPSGSGKTTLLNVIAGFLRPDAGALAIGGEDMTLRPVNERGLGMVFQNYALFPHMTVGENVAFPLKARKVPAAQISESVRSVLRLVQLEHLLDQSVTTLSGGQRQRVALARAVVFSPKVVLMDEPLSALDKSLREQMQVEIRRLHDRIGATTVYVTHDQREALTMSDRIAVMRNGRILQCDTPTAVYETPRSAFVAGFIGETALLPVSPAPEGALLGEVLLRSTRPLPAPGKWCVAIRSERLLLPRECGAAVNRIPVTVRDVIYQGDSLLILAEVAGGREIAIRRSVADLRATDAPAAGERISLGLAFENTLIVAEDA